MKSYLKTELNKFVESFSPGFNFVYSSLFDLLFFMIISGTIMLFGRITNFFGEKVNTGLLAQDALMKATEPELAALYSQLKGLLVWTVISIMAIAAISLLLWSFTRGKIYTKLLKKRFTPDYFRKMIGLNMVLGFIFLLVLVFISLLLKTQVVSLAYLSMAMLLAIVYFFIMICIKFTKTNKVFASIGEGLEMGAKRSLKLLLPGILILAVGVLFDRLISLLPQSVFLSIIAFVIFIAWARIYFINSVERA